MTFEKPPEISRRAIDKAGSVLIDENSTPEQQEEARKVLNRWRASHGYPINTFQATLRTKTRKGTFGNGVIIAQRLKRAPTIIEKLQQGKSNDITLLNMQDIAGVRAILPTLEDVRKLEKVYRSMGRFEHILHPRSKDYINEPKERDGYRSIHLIYKYKNKLHPEWDNLWVELQIRTAMQHSWATAVESMHTFLGKAIKTRQGQEADQKWTEFFRSVSSAFAYIEKTPVVECHKNMTKEQILEDIRKYERELKVIEKLKAFHAAMNLITTEIPNSHFYLIVMDIQAHSVRVTSFRRDQSDVANFAYEKAEAEAIGKDNIESVLVSANEVKEAYPSFFANTKDFRDNLRKVLSGEWITVSV